LTLGDSATYNQQKEARGQQGRERIKDKKSVTIPVSISEKQISQVGAAISLPPCI
jgi:hypothetical protein